MNINNQIRYWASLINESEQIMEGGWSKPKLDIETLKAAVQKAKQDDDGDGLSPDYFGKEIDFNPQSNDFNATVSGKDVILQDGQYNGDNEEI